MSDHMTQNGTGGPDILFTKGVPYGQNVIVRALFFGTIGLLLLETGALLYFFRPSDTPIVLHYNVYFGVDVIGRYSQAFIVPVITAIYLVGNFALGRLLYQAKERVAAYTLLFGGLLLVLSSIVAAGAVIFANY
jgi:hypothetical protein